MRLLAMTILTAVAVTGCASTQSTANGGSGATGPASASPTAGDPGSSRPTVRPSESPTGKSVNARCPAQLNEGQYNGRRPLPNGATVDWVLRCTVAPQSDGSRFVLVERSDSDPAGLLAALRAADQPRTRGACPMIRPLVPYFALVLGDGRTWPPKIPLTGCGLPQPAVLKALNGLQFVVIDRMKLP